MPHETQYYKVTELGLIFLSALLYANNYNPRNIEMEKSNIKARHYIYLLKGSMNYEVSYY